MRYSPLRLNAAFGIVRHLPRFAGEEIQIT